MAIVSWKRLGRALVVALAGAAPLSTVSCEADQIQALVQGFETVADEIEDQQEVTLGEWLSSELDDD